MPTEQPSNTATEALPTDARDDRNAASVLSDPALDQDSPGGGGLGGTTAGTDPLSGTGDAPRGTSPNAPIDVPLPSSAQDADASAEAEARRQASQDDGREPQPVSR